MSTKPHRQKLQAVSRAGWAWRVLGFILIAGALGLMWPRADGRDLGTDSVSQPEAVPPSIVVATVERRDLTPKAEGTGHLQAWQTVELTFEAEGRVAAVSVEEGSRIHRGDPIACLDDRRLRFELAEAEANLLTVQARYAVFAGLDQVGDGPRPMPPSSETEPSRTTSLDDAEASFEAGLISQRELERTRRTEQAVAFLEGRYKDEVRAATTGLLQAELGLDRARLELESACLEAPFSGQVADLSMVAGERVTTADPVLVLIDTQRMRVEVEVLEADLVRLRRGDPVQVRIPALDDRRVPGTIRSINPRVDSETGSGRVVVAVERPGPNLLPGLFAWVEFEIDRLAARLVVPEAAVLERRGRPVIFRVSEGRAEWIDVGLGTRSEGWVEVTNGLAQGDQVAVSGHLALGHGAEVTIADSPRESSPGQGGAP